MFDLSFRDQLLDRSGNFFDRHVRVAAVLIEEIDAVGLESLKRRVRDHPDTFRPAIEPGR